MSACKFHWSDAKETVLVCRVHENERQVIKPADKDSTVKMLQEAGEWDADVTEGEGKKPAVKQEIAPRTAPAMTPTVIPPVQGVIEYQSLSGVAIQMTIKGFQELVCPMANSQQAQFMIAWCHHNRIDPFSEAHFSIMDGKPVIQIAKDAWFKRMEVHPDFASHDSGILVRVSIGALRLAARIEADDYVINPAFKAELLKAEADEFPVKLTVKKRGQFVDEGEELVGGWALIFKKSRPAPTLFQIPVKGWETKKSGNDLNIFWATKASFMIWKSALKNCCRLAFPDLSGLLSVPEFAAEDEEDAPLRMMPHADDPRTAALRELHAAGAAVPMPYGPFSHLDLHHLAAATYHVDSLTGLTQEQLGELIGTVTSAAADDELAHQCVTAIEQQGGTRDRSLKLARTRRTA